MVFVCGAARALGMGVTEVAFFGVAFVAVDVCAVVVVITFGFAFVFVIS